MNVSISLEAWETEKVVELLEKSHDFDVRCIKWKLSNFLEAARHGRKVK